MDNKAMFNLSYGLFILTAKDWAQALRLYCLPSAVSMSSGYISSEI